MLVFNNFRSQLTKAVMVLFACGVLLFSTAAPAMAFGSSSSNPSDGVTEMNTLKEISKRAVNSEPRSREEVQRKAQEGPNSVQGGADLNKMNTPENSRQATPVGEQIENAIESVMPGR